VAAVVPGFELVLMFMREGLLRRRGEKEGLFMLYKRINEISK
jgi:hypothetical protein